MIHTDIGKSEDAEVLEELYTAYAQKLLSVCRRYVKDEDVAQDILHDAFIIIFTSFGSLKNKTHPEGWMTTIVRNLCLKYLQSTGRQPLTLSAVDTETLPEEQPDNAEKISLDRLWTAIESLPKGHREVFKLAVLDGLSHKEIGRMLGIAPHSSSSQLSRAKKMLRQLLAHYRLLLLVPVLVAVYLYFNTSSESDDLTANKPTIIQQQPENRLQMTRKQPVRRPEKAMSMYNKKGRGQLRVVAKRVEEKPSVVVAQNPIDSVSVASPVSSIHTDSLQRHWAASAETKDTLLRLPQMPAVQPVTWAANTSQPRKKKYRWTFNFGYSSHAVTNNPLYGQDYLSVIDYANGGATAKLYTWDDYTNYLNRNSLLLDSVEKARLTWIAINNYVSDGEMAGENVRHHRPRTFGLSLSKQLSPHWIFGTGLNYTRLKSELTSDYNKATLEKTQKIDYIGIPLRLTYRIWSKGRFNAYTTGGITFDIPIRSRLDKRYIITSDSSYVRSESLRTRCQWSVNWGVGVQYRLFKPFSFYVEPNMYYYFKDDSGIETYRTEHPFTIAIPFGLRLTW